MKSGARWLVGMMAALLLFMPLGPLLREALDTLESGSLLRILEDAQWTVLLANSIFLALITTLFAVLLAWPVAVALGRCRQRGRGLLQALTVLPLLIPPHIHAIAWTRVLGDKGWLSLWLREQGMSLNIRAPLGGIAASDLTGHIYAGPAWVMACAFFPLIALPVAAALQRTDRDALDAARLQLGFVPRWRAALLPPAAPALLTGSAAVFALALVTYPVVSLLDTPVLVQKIYFVFSQVDQTAGTVLSLPLVLLSLALLWLISRLERGFAANAPQHVAPLQRALLTPLAAWMILALGAGVPLVSLLREAGPLALAGGTDNYQTVFARTQEAFTDSLLLVGATVTVLGLLSLLLGRALAKHSSAFSDATAGVALALPPVIVGVALLVQMGRADAGDGWWLAAGAGLLAGMISGGPLLSMIRCALLTALTAVAVHWLLTLGLARSLLSQGMTLPVLGWLALYLPLCVRLMRQAFRSADADGVAAGRLAGMPLLARFRAAEWPAVSGVFGAVLLVSWVLCFSELSAVLLLLRPGWQFLQIRIFNMVHYQAAGEVAALCVLTVMVTLLPLLAVWLLRRERRA